MGGWLSRPSMQDLLWAVGLTFLAWGHRIFFLLSNRDRDWPFTIFYQGDAHAFFRQARAFISGELYDEGIPFHPPGFSFLLSLLHTLLGAGDGAAQIPHRSVKIVLALLASGAVGLLFLLAKPYVGRTAAILASLFLTYHFGHYVISIAPVGEGVFLTLLLAALLLWSRRLDHGLAIPRPAGARPRHRPRDGLLLGLLAGASALLRVESVLIIGVLVAVGLWHWGRGAWAGVRGQRLEKNGGESAPAPAEEEKKLAEFFPALVPWILVGVGWILVVAPWTVRNYGTLGDYNARMGSQLAEQLPTFVPVTIYGPINLALANQDGASGAFSPEALTGATGGDSLDLTREKHLEWLLHGDRIAWQWIRHNPGDFAHLVTLKWGLSAEVFSLGFGQLNWPGGLDGVRRPVDIFVPESRSFGWYFPGLMAVGLILAWRRPETRKFAFLVGLITACFLFTTALFYGYVRLALLYLPLWSVLAALPVVRVCERFTIPGKVWILGGAVMVAALFWLEASGSSADRNYRASASSTTDGHHLNPDDEIILERVE